MKKEVGFTVEDMSDQNIQTLAAMFGNDKRVDAGVELGFKLLEATMAIADAPFEKVKHFLAEHLQDDPERHSEACQYAKRKLLKDLGISPSTERRLLGLYEWRDEIKAQQPKTLTAAYAMCDNLKRTRQAMNNHTVNGEASQIEEIQTARRGGRPKKLPEARAREHLAKAFRFWKEAGMTEDLMIKEVSEMFAKDSEFGPLMGEGAHGHYEDRHNQPNISGT